MEAVRERWTDDRMDDLNHKVDELARRTDEGFRDLRREMNDGFSDLREELNARFAQVDARFDAMHRTLLQLGGGTIAALLGLIATQL